MTVNYESMIIIDPAMSTEDAEKENQKIIKLIQDNGGALIKTDVLGKKQLAYEIKKKKEGFYFINYFSLDADRAKEIERYYRINETVLRYNLLKNGE